MLRPTTYLTSGSCSCSVSGRWHFPQSLPLVLIKRQPPVFWEQSAFLQGFSLGIYPLHSSKVSGEIEIFHCLDYASTFSNYSQEMSIPGEIFWRLTALRLCRRVAFPNEIIRDTHIGRESSSLKESTVSQAFLLKGNHSLQSVGCPQWSRKGWLGSPRWSPCSV